VSRGIRVLSAKCRTKSVYLAQCQGTKLTLKLTGDSKVDRLPEEILFIIYCTILFAGQVFKVKGCHMEHLAGAFGVTSCYNGCMQVIESPVIEILVNCISHGVADAHHCSEGVRAEAQMGYLPEELH